MSGTQEFVCRACGQDFGISGEDYDPREDYSLCLECDRTRKRLLNPRDCLAHGQLAKSCSSCEFEKEIAHLRKWKHLVMNGGDVARDRFVAGEYLTPVVDAWKAEAAKRDAQIKALTTERDEARSYHQRTYDDLRVLGGKYSAALKREGRLREALKSIYNGDHNGCAKDTSLPGEDECPECIIEKALTGEQ